MNNDNSLGCIILIGIGAIIAWIIGVPLWAIAICVVLLFISG